MNNKEFGIDKLWYILQKKIYSINEKTLKGMNTILHFAVYYENIKMIRHLVKDKAIFIHERNSQG